MNYFANNVKRKKLQTVLFGINLFFMLAAIAAGLISHLIPSAVFDSLTLFAALGLIWLIVAVSVLAFSVITLYKIIQREKSDKIFLIVNIISIPLGFGMLAIAYLIAGIF